MLFQGHRSHANQRRTVRADLTWRWLGCRAVIAAAGGPCLAFWQSSPISVTPRRLAGRRRFAGEASGIAAGGSARLRQRIPSALPARTWTAVSPARVRQRTTLHPARQHRAAANTRIHRPTRQRPTPSARPHPASRTRPTRPAGPERRRRRAYGATPSPPPRAVYGASGDGAASPYGNGNPYSNAAAKSSYPARRHAGGYGVASAPSSHERLSRQQARIR